MSERLQGKCALVIGTRRGIGEAIARALSAEGASVIVTDRDEKAAARSACELDCTGAQLDVARSPIGRL